MNDQTGAPQEAEAIIAAVLRAVEVPLDHLSDRIRPLEAATKGAEGLAAALLEPVSVRLADLLPAPVVRNGADGKDGVGVAGAVIDRAGLLVLTLTDGTTRDLGVVVGRDGIDGQEGRAGRDGKDGADGVGLGGAMIDREGHLILTLTSGKAVKLGVIVGKDGKDGRDGDPGKGGLDGKDGAEPTAEQIARAVASHLEAHPPEPRAATKDVSADDIREVVEGWLVANPPASGADGRDGKDATGLAGALVGDGGDLVLTLSTGEVLSLGRVVGPPGRDGKDGKDGVSLAGAMIDRSGDLVVTMSDGMPHKLGVVVGADGKNGADGAAGKDGERGEPGFALEDFDSEVRDGGRTLVLSFTAGDTKHTAEHQLDTAIYRKVFKEGATYQPGDMVSFGGGVWHCDAETDQRPGDDSKFWTLAVRRGRDGKSVTLDEVMPVIVKAVADMEQRLAKRLDLAIERGKR